MVEYVVEPKSRKQLRALATILREYLGLKNEIFFPIVELLDVMCELFPKFSYEIVPDSTFPDNVHADTDVMSQHIRIKERAMVERINRVWKEKKDYVWTRWKRSN